MGEGFGDELVELGAVDYFNEGRAFGVVGGDDPYGGGVLDADALAEGVVGFDFSEELALGVERKGQGDVVVSGELGRKCGKDFRADDGGLIGEDLVTVLVAEGFAFGVEPAGVDGGEQAPVMEGEREVVADPGDVVGGGGLLEDDVGAGAVGALEVFKLDDGDAGSGGGTERGGGVDLGSGLRRGELGVGCRAREKRGGGEGQKEADTCGASGNGLGKAHEAMHRGWMAP